MNAPYSLTDLKFIRDGGEILQPDNTRDYEQRGGLWVPIGTGGTLKWSTDFYSFSSVPSFGGWLGTSDETAKVVEQAHSTSEIVAWRCWRVLAEKWERPALWSVHRATEWDSAVLHADSEPTTGNNSGVYALAAREAIQYMLNDHDPYVNVYGEVALTGTVVEGTSGYRGATATIRSLYVRRGTWNMPPLALAEELSQRYEVVAELDVDTEPTPVEEDED